MVTKSATATIAAGQFKAKCLAVLDEVQKTRRSVVITKRGKPVARLVPMDDRSALDDLRGSILYEGDIVSPMLDVWFPAK